MIEHVILLHGLWMRGFALAMLHRRMMEAGFRVHRFDYLSVANTQERILERLNGRMVELAEAGSAVHLVGHSLGGLLALQVCQDTVGLPPGRVVCLGSPLLGSAAAREFSGLGRSGEALLGHQVRQRPARGERFLRLSQHHAQPPHKGRAQPFGQFATQPLRHHAHGLQARMAQGTQNLGVTVERGDGEWRHGLILAARRHHQAVSPARQGARGP